MSSDLAVTGISARAERVPTDSPEADGTLEWDATTVVCVEARAADERGLGWTYTSSAATDVIDDLLCPAVVGRSAMDPAGANAAMSRAVRNVGRVGVAAAAISAVDVALWDLKARLLDLPLTALLGRVHDDVEVYGSGGFTTYDDARTARQVEGWIEAAGIERVKIKIGESWGSRIDRDLARVRFVQGLIGDRELFVDANGAYTIGQAKRIGRMLDDSGVTWFEEPVSSDDLDGLRLLRDQLSADVAAGEYGDGLVYFRRMLSAGAVDCLQIDVTRCGGITDFMRAAALAAAHGVEVSAHCAPHLHGSFVAAVPNLRHVEYFHDHARIEEQLVFAGADPPKHGRLAPRTDCAGHGMSLRRSMEGSA